MTTKTQNVPRCGLAEAEGAVKLLRERFGSVAAGSADAIALDDASALIAVLTAAAADYNANAPHWQVDTGNTYALTWSTTGHHDATTRAQLLNWLSGSPTPPWFGANHYAGSNGDLLPRLGDGLLGLINQL